MIFAGAALLVAGGILLHRISDVVRGRPVTGLDFGGNGQPPAVLAPGFADELAATADVSLAGNHDVEVLTDQRVFDALLADLSGARRSITFTTYFCAPGRLAGRVADVLAERARAGVRVLLLVDDYGCASVLRQVGATLAAAGVRVAVLRPVRWFTLDRAQHRSHVRYVVVDGEIGYTGGFGLADEWSGDAGVAWRDTSVRFRGPAVPALQAAFLASWAEATGTLLGGPLFYPEPGPEGAAASAATAAPAGTAAPAPRGVTAGLLVSAPGLGTSRAERALAVTVGAARRTLFVSNSYFVPPPLLLRQLEDAARRGVDVRLLLPGPIVDHATTRWAGRAYYQGLLEAGVRIWEYRETMLHAKTLIADGVWGWIGTMNLDNRSMRLNDEDALLVLDARVGRELEEQFFRDLAHAEEITRTGHAARPALERIRERLTRSIAPVL